VTSIRLATPDDVEHILALIRELAEYEREPEAVTATTADLLRDGFGDRPRYTVLLACEGDEVAGFAFYFFTYSTWRGRPTLYLEDLFVRPRFRRRGLGLRLMQRLAKEALRANCARFRWQVLDWNEPAIVFYQSLGANVLKQWWTVSLEGDALARLANGAD
jgi:GNAT superfamily N-acetyltransferase